MNLNMIGVSKYYKAVRKFAVTTPIWSLSVRHDIKPDEINDLTLIARRVYGDSDEAITVMAAAGLDRINQSLKAGETLVLPTAAQVQQLKTKTGFPIQDTRNSLRGNLGNA
jgi:hypothetical protein